MASSKQTLRKESPDDHEITLTGGAEWGVGLGREAGRLRTMLDSDIELLPTCIGRSVHRKNKIAPLSSTAGTGVNASGLRALVCRGGTR